MAWESVDGGGLTTKEGFVMGRYNPKTGEVQARFYEGAWEKIGEASDDEGARTLVWKFATKH